MYQYPHIKKIILVTGDADFRPLLQSMRKNGLETYIICDAKSASEDLLLLADAYKDFRELIPVAGDDADDEEDDDEELDAHPTAKSGRGRRPDNAREGGKEGGHLAGGGSRKSLSFEDSIVLLKEAVQIMQKNNKPTSIGSVKIRMKLLNGNFNEKGLRFRTWKSYVVAAVKKDPALELVYNDNDISIVLKPAAATLGGSSGPSPGQSGTTAAGGGQAGALPGAIRIPEVIRQLLVAVKNSASSKGQENWVPYSMVSQYLIDIGVDIREHNYGRIRTLVEAAEKRNLVETRSESQHWLVRLTPEGTSYC